MKKLFAFSLLALLAACATPQQRCVDRAAADVRMLERQIARIEGNIDRGYAVHRSTGPRVGVTACTGGQSLRLCQELSNEPRETPVAISIPEEKRKLAKLTVRLADARARAADAPHLGLAPQA